MDLRDFVGKKQEQDIKPIIIECSCGSKYSSRLGRCPNCGINHESEEMIKNWSKI